MTTWPSTLWLSLDRSPTIAPKNSGFPTMRALLSISCDVSSTEAQSNPGCPSCSDTADFSSNESSRKSCWTMILAKLDDKYSRHAGSLDQISNRRVFIRDCQHDLYCVRAALSAFFACATHLCTALPGRCQDGEEACPGLVPLKKL